MSEENEIGIQHICYRFTHIPTGQFYVGRSQNYVGRRFAHLSALRLGKHKCKKLQALYDSDPDFRNFEWSAIICLSKANSIEWEQKTLDEYWDKGLILNSTPDASSPITGVLRNPDEEAKRVTALKKVLAGNDYAAKQRDSGLKRWAVPGAKEARRGSGNPFAKAVIINGVKYGSVKEAEKAVGLCEKTIRKRANLEGYPEYVWA